MPDPRPALVLTTIQAPNQVMQALAAGCRGHGFDFIIIGDRNSSVDFALEGTRYLDLEAQRASGLAYADLCPEDHYARKNIGYLTAIQSGVPLIVETDDDNLPAQGFFAPRAREQRVSTARACGWVNVYRYFADGTTWPRGLPLDEIMRAPVPYDSLAVDIADCPIQQGLADDNPDVDAVYRLCQPLPVRFRRDRRLALGRDAWCPFNSQNTAWWPDAYPLLYLPATCSFRMTDIWRSFVAQRIAWVNGWSVLFHEPTVTQARNDHNLMRDFEDEVPGYLHNRAIAARLAGLDLVAGVDAIADNLRACYAALAEMELVASAELALLGAWLLDLAALRAAPPSALRRRAVA